MTPGAVPVDPETLRELLDKATPRPWFDTGDITTPALDIAADPYVAIGQPPSAAWPNNAALIVAAVNALPDLLAEISALGSQLETLKQENERLRENQDTRCWGTDHPAPCRWPHGPCITLAAGFPLKEQAPMPGRTYSGSNLGSGGGLSQ